ncbi:hypothetical protein TEA_028163 [Camellia sinensis var. sinensis]|uniref:Uncharacterized protein n=1 Tax=Camellia sinensis var. sinensis TaxID=542762 RepID=A0A4S4D9U1_CAMSN|nr:hypothetical protein TEA_028163 [Camellia sinensis var. sinensis]
MLGMDDTTITSGYRKKGKGKAIASSSRGHKYDPEKESSGTPCNLCGSSTTSKKRAREAEGIAKGLVDMAVEFGSFFKKTNTTMEEIAHRIGYAHDLSQARKLVNGELVKLPLNTNDRLRVATLIVKDAEMVDLFFSFPEEEKMEWVCLLLVGCVCYRLMKDIYLYIIIFSLAIPPQAHV